MCVCAFLAALAATWLQSPDQSTTCAEKATQQNATQEAPLVSGQEACLAASGCRKKHADSASTCSMVRNHYTLKGFSRPGLLLVTLCGMKMNKLGLASNSN